MKHLNPDTVERETGYRPQTTFFDDFSIADTFGEDAIRDTYKRAFDEWHTNKVYITELVMMLNWKIWEHHRAGDKAKALLYQELWEKADNWCLDNLKDDDLSYFLNTID